MSGADSVARFAAALNGVMGEIDWARLGRAYYEGDSSDFFDDERRQRIVDVGLEIADGVATLLDARGTRRNFIERLFQAQACPRFQRAPIYWVEWLL